VEDTNVMTRFSLHIGFESFEDLRSLILYLQTVYPYMSWVIINKKLKIPESIGIGSHASTEINVH
jgi:hypothetical protein